MISIRLRVNGIAPILSLIDFKVVIEPTRVYHYATIIFYYSIILNRLRMYDIPCVLSLFDSQYSSGASYSNSCVNESRTVT